MTTLMTTLTVFRPRGQQPEVFHDPDFEELRTNNHGGNFRVYSYEVLSGNVLKIYTHKAQMDVWGDWKVKKNKEPLEIAHFRPNQWDTVRSGRPSH